MRFFDWLKPEWARGISPRVVVDLDTGDGEWLGMALGLFPRASLVGLGASPRANQVKARAPYRVSLMPFLATLERPLGRILRPSDLAGGALVRTGGRWGALAACPELLPHVIREVRGD